MMSHRIERARTFALRAHVTQKYGTEFPYIIHFQTAYMVAVRFGVVDEDVLVAVWLHDILEDTVRTPVEIAGLFGDRVVSMVTRVTDPTGMTRKEKHAISYPIIKEDPNARIIKLCDRISHLEFGGNKVSMYRKEHNFFKSSLQTPNPPASELAMWEYLDNLIADIS